MSKRQVQKSEGGQRATNNKNKTQGSATKKPTGVKAPTAQAHVVKTQKAKLKTLPNGDCVISHREYIGEIVSSATLNAFRSIRYAVNAGEQGTFAWLSTLAQNFESYRFEKLVFEFETEASTLTGGSVILALDYDPTDKAPITKQQAMTYRNSVRSPPWSDSKHISSQEDLNKRKSYFVNSTALGSVNEVPDGPRLSDVGNLFVCTQGMPVSTTAGELYVTYRCRLMTPVYGQETKVGVFLNSGAIGSTAALPMGSTADEKPLPLNYIPRGQLSILPFGKNAAGDQQFRIFGCAADRSYYLSMYLLSSNFNGITGTANLTFVNATVNILANPSMAPPGYLRYAAVWALTPNTTFLIDKFILFSIDSSVVSGFSAFLTPTQAGIIVSEQPLA